MVAYRYLLQSSTKALATNKGRSLLTILGIVIGITSIILIVAIGQGAKQLVLNEIGGLGADIIAVRPGREPKGPSDIAGTLFGDSLKARDVTALEQKSNAPFIKEVMPFVLVPGSISYGDETMQPQIFGGSIQFFSETFNLTLAQGEFFTESDIRSLASVAVIGSKVKDELFGLSDAIGQKIKIKGRNFRVVGVLAPKGQIIFGDVDKLVVIPETTAQKYLLGIDYYNEIVVRTTSPDMVDRTVQDIEATLRETHNIDNPSKDDFFVVTQKGVVEQVGIILGALTTFLSAVVAISLVVGGVGVMNVMLVSVRERTREIGLRKAVGATNRDILVQFLLESVLLTVAGGIIGILLGFVFSVFAAFIITNVAGLTWIFTFPLSASILGIGMAAFVGIIFGLYPAYQASRKSPIEALRYE